MSEERFSEVRSRPSVDQLLRTVQQHHVHLSAMADTKAGPIITISSIVLTIALSRAGDPQLRAALLTLAMACLLALLLAIFAVLPTFAPLGKTVRSRVAGRFDACCWASAGPVTAASASSAGAASRVKVER